MTMMKSLDAFIETWKQDAINAARPTPKADDWCRRCGTRPVSKDYAPYCSALCLDDATFENVRRG